MDLNYFKKSNGYEIEDGWYPRVTSICDIIAKPGLLKYYAEQKSFNIAQSNMVISANWGKLAHDIIEKKLAGKECGILPAILPSINAFERWLSRHKINALNFEETVLSKNFLYAGTFDVLAEIDGKLGILDLKTSTGIWDEYSLQTAAYVQAYNEKTCGKAKTRWILRVDQYQECEICGAKKRDKESVQRIRGGKTNCQHYWGFLKGTYEFKELKDQKKDLKIFLHAKKLWEWSNRYWIGQVKNSVIKA